MQTEMQATALAETAPQFEPAKSQIAETRWPAPALLGFRFAFVYLVLYSFPAPLVFLPGASSLFGWYETLWQKIVIWTGAHILHLSQPVQYVPTGSGDTMHAYIQNMLTLIIAAVAMIVWSVLDRKRQEYVYLHEWLRLFVRLVLGATLLTYGAAKVIKAQFPYPFLGRLIEPYGDSSPMGLLWTLMGYSLPYNVFTGLVEMIGGALVIVPRLATLGALVSLGAMANVFMLNMSYDVPVKIYSLNLLLMSGFLLLPELRRLTNVFILNQTAEPVIAPPLFRRRWLNVGLLAAQLLFLAYCAGADLYQSQQGRKQYGDLAPRPQLYGIYAVDEFVVDGQIRPPLFSDETRWRRVAFDLYNSVSIQPSEGPMQRYTGKFDVAAETLQLTRRGGDQSWKANFTFNEPAPGVLALSGEMDGKKIQASLRKIDLKSFPLNSRGFHWISEFPFNR